MKIGMRKNEYGNTVSVHWCETCGEEFTVCPPVRDTDAWRGCLRPECTSYDPERDADKLFDSGRCKRETTNPEGKN
jgi:hypothetical protein